MTTHTYETTYEVERGGAVVSSTEIRIHYTYSPGRSEQYCARTGVWEPEEHESIEIIQVEEEFPGGWEECGPWLFGMVADWAETALLDTLIEAVSDAEEARQEDTADARYQERRDFEGMIK